MKPVKMATLAIIVFTMFETHSGYIPIAADKAHARIIWDCGWAIEGDIFATASRDKTVFDDSSRSSSTSHPQAI